MFMSPWGALGALLIFAASASAGAQTGSSGLQCVADQLASCRMVNRQVNASSLSQYAKAFNCVKHGSTSGTKFGANIPIPDGGMFGLDFGSSAQHSTNVCQEEVRKLESASFLKSYGEVFNEECGRTLAGQYEQCLRAKVALETTTAPPPQSFSCNTNQTGRGLVINLRYVPAQGEEQKRYTVDKIVGPKGLKCEKGIVAGTHYATSLSCELPEPVAQSTVVVRLRNGISCNVAVSPAPAIEIAAARKHSCAAVLGRIPDATNFPFLVRTTMIGLCDSCLAANLATEESDLRSVSTRLEGCLAWAAKTVVASGIEWCKQGTPPSGFISPYGVQPEHAVLSAAGSTIGPAEMAQAAALCQTRPGREVISIKDLGRAPIDYLAAEDAANPQLRELRQGIREAMK